MSNADRLIYMANQIARNLQAQGDEFAVDATADHIATFWDPRMRERILAYLDTDGSKLGEIATLALRLLAYKGAPAPQTPATEFDPGDGVDHSDAG